MDVDKVYQRIGEFVVCFQWIESRFREIGWLIVDPDRQRWPPTILREETTNDLVEKVDELFTGCIHSLGLDDSQARRESFRAVVDRFHGLRRKRNRILHSAFIELKAGGDIVGIVRTNPRLSTDAQSPTASHDQEFLTEESFASDMAEMTHIALELSMHYYQLVHRLPHAAETGRPEKANSADDNGPSNPDAVG